ncbi:MAG TPA: xanthan lyase, partial [Armatimonadota bacterium]|nr:xanthan lyase [Armatimonadota bacterium]
SAATAACQAIDRRVPVQRVSLKALQERLRADGQILEWKGGVNTVALLAPKSFPGIALDDKDGVKTGEWIPSSIPGGRLIGTGYLHDGNANKGKLAIAYTPNLPLAGEYQIILFASPNPNRATNAPVTITVAGGDTYRLRVNQRDPAPEGALNLGRFHLPAGSNTTVTLSNADTDGHVIADGIQFLPIKP